MLKKITAPTMKDARRKIASEIGPDAVILSSRNTDEGFEIICSTMTSMSAMVPEQSAATEGVATQQSARTSQAAPEQQNSPLPLSAAAGSSPAIEARNATSGQPVLSGAVTTQQTPNSNLLDPSELPTLKDKIQSIQQTRQDAHQDAEPQGKSSFKAPSIDCPSISSFVVPSPIIKGPPTPVSGSCNPVSAASPNHATSSVQKRQSTQHSARPVIEADYSVQVSKQFEEIKSLIEKNNESTRWTGELMTYPVVGLMFEELINIGFSPLFIKTLLRKMPKHLSENHARAWVRDVIRKNIKVTPSPDEMLKQGGVFAIVGPTGSGKTTTTAKIAARAVITSGPDSVGLITTDTYRVGAQDQIRQYAKILGIQVFTANSEDEIGKATDSMSRKKLILVDTMGTANDKNEQESQDLMLEKIQAKTVIALNTALQSEVLSKVVSLNLSLRTIGCILTKVDETVRLAGAVDVSIRNKLPIHYLATGQRVPEDLYHPSTELLIKKILGHRTPSAHLLSASQLLGKRGVLSNEDDHE